MRRLTLALAILAGCTPDPAHIEQEKLDRRAAVEKYAADLQLTVVAVTCVGFERGDVGVRRHRCDLRTREAGVLPLVCNSACRLLD